MSEEKPADKTAENEKQSAGNKNTEEKLELSSAVRILFALTTASVVFLLAMRFIERERIRNCDITVYTSEIFEEKTEGGAVAAEEKTNSALNTSEYSSAENAEKHNQGKVNLNTADKKLLMSLPGIGEVKAMSILDYRKENGRFRSAEELMKVKGIGEKTYEKIKEMITVG